MTFSNQVVRILQTHCQTCHRTGGIAPFPLVSYGDAFANRANIALQTSQGNMPPWHVDSSCARYADDPSLTAQEIETLSRWVSAGAPQGDPRDLPPERTFPDGWELGSPDRVLTMPEPMTPDFSNGDVYRCFVLPTGLSEDRFVSAAEVAPGVRQMVHHVLLFVDTGDTARQLDEREPGPGYTCFGGPGFDLSLTSPGLGGWAPGNRPRPLPDGVGMSLPAGSTVVMQVHYSARSGIREPDRTSVGLHYVHPPVERRLPFLPVINLSFAIPAGAPDHEVTASIPFLPFALHVLNVTPHMHLLGRKMTVTATPPGGGQVCVVNVPDWDFHWQATYTYPPIALPFGSRIDLSAHYDNSAENPENPHHPPQDVRWGENTTDEMCIAFLGVTLDEENLASSLEPAGRCHAAVRLGRVLGASPNAVMGRPWHNLAMKNAIHNFHLPLPPELYAALKKEAKKRGRPATAIARSAIESWLSRARASELHEEIASYAVKHGGSDVDLDRSLEAAGIESLLESD